MKTNRHYRPKVKAQITMAKKLIARDINKAIEDRGLNQTTASHFVGDAPSQISLICTGKLRGFSLERLILTRALLGGGVQIAINNSEGPPFVAATKS